MNALSWLFYGMDVINSFRVALQLFSAMALMGIFVYTIIYFTEELKDQGYTSPFKYAIAPVIILFLTAFLPSQDTMKLIAASEIGERVIKSERVSGIVDPSLDIMKNKLILFNRELEKQINGETSKK